MALLTWRDRNTRGLEIGPLWYLDFDATLLEEFTRSADITTFPIESGAVLSDHHQPQPRAITLEVMVSDTPVKPPNTLPGKTSAAPQPPGFSLGPILYFAGRVTRVVDTFDVLDGLLDNSILVNIVLFGDQEYKNMVISNMRAPRTAEDGTSLTFTVDFLQVAFATTESSSLDAGTPKETKDEQKRDTGNRNGTPVERNDPARGRIVSTEWYNNIDTSKLPPSLLQ
jgi:hypothetical protein